MIVNENTGWLQVLKSPPGSIVKHCKPEYCHVAMVNSEGCNDVEWRMTKTKKHRVACIGDSFTVGLGGTQILPLNGYGKRSTLRWKP